MLEKNLKEHFTNYSLKLPKKAKFQAHYWADYIELKALFNNGDDITVGEIFDCLDDAIGLGDVDETELLGNLDENNFITEDGSIFDNNDDGSNHSAKEDKIYENIEKWFLVINDRKKLYKTSYPFVVQQNSIRLKKKLNSSHKLYLYFSLCSSLNNFSNELRAPLTSEFENISNQALKSFLPNSTVKSFGKNTDYTGNAKQKIRKLAKDLNIQIKEEDGFDQIAPQNNQEKGLDLIAWLPFDDLIPNTIIILCQCACGKDWHNKSGETKRYENYLNFYRQNPIHSMFIPYSIVNINGRFYQDDDFSEKLMFDRTRMIGLIKNFISFKKLDSYKIVDFCIAYEEDIV